VGAVATGAFADLLCTRRADVGRCGFDSRFGRNYGRSVRSGSRVDRSIDAHVIHLWRGCDPPALRDILDDVKILMVSPEIATFTRSGGVAEGVSSLSRALAQRGHDVNIVVPRYRSGETSEMNVVAFGDPIQLTTHLTTSSETIEARFFETRIAASATSPGVRVLLFDMPGFHDVHGIWGDEFTDSTDNARRFALFARSVLHVLREETTKGKPFDVVHCHDWPSAIVPYLLREARAQVPHTRSVLTIHNLYFQGTFPIEAIEHLVVEGDHTGADRIGHFGHTSFLKAGIVSADLVATVSPSYAREICTKKFGEGLDHYLSSRRGGVHGITNGIDVALWDPATDAHLPANYDVMNPSNKATCKEELVRELGLEDKDAPLIVSLGRVCGQKGSDLLANIASDIVKLGANVVVAGEGEPEMTEALKNAAISHPRHFKFIGFAKEQMAHRMVASGDVLVMPSRFEPCGVVQMYGQRYGTLPIACRTGGLADTIIDLDASPETGTGILFEGPTEQTFLDAITRGLRTIASPAWNVARTRMMSLRLGWSGPTQRYEAMYRTLLQMPRA
jgi:starch synthase